jgi:hypothetical protein
VITLSIRKFRVARRDRLRHISKQRRPAMTIAFTGLPTVEVAAIRASGRDAYGNQHRTPDLRRRRRALPPLPETGAGGARNT